MGNSSVIIAISLLLVAFLLTVVMLPKLIKYLHYLKFGQEIRQEGPQSHIHKKGTPTMGGISFILAIVVALIIAMFLNSENIKYYLLFIYTTVSFAIIGYIDDMLIVVKKKNDGLSPRKKLLLQIVFSLIFYILVSLVYDNVNFIEIPIINYQLNISYLYLLFVIFWQTGFSNAVNLTDGLDTLSVIIQVAYFKKTGKRIFKMSPLHHHFELTGYGEVKTVYIFVIIAVISSAIGYFIGVI